MVSFGCVCCENSDATSWHELLHLFGLFCAEFRKPTKWFQMHPNSMKHTKNFSLGSNGVDRVSSMQKIPTRLRGTNFYTSLARFAPNSVRQPNSSKCAQIKRNVPNISLRSNGVDRVRSLRKIPTRLHCTNLCTCSACFAPSFVRQPNDSMLPNRTKHTKTSV